ncbi:MAG: transglutaminase domain-containing protein [Candidatus Woesearchaeota archaeon]
MTNKQVLIKKNKKQLILYLMIIFFLIMLFNSHIIIAEEDKKIDYNKLINSKSADLEVNMTFKARLFRNENSNIKNISLKTRAYPKNNSYQRVLFFETQPSSKIINNELFSELMPNEILYFKLNSIVQRQKTYLVDREISFPQTLKVIDDDIYKKLQRTEKLNFNERIKHKASEITEGSPDLFTAVSQIGFWIYKNMEYDLNYSNVEKDALWVFENMRGTCDEYSNLYAAMLRSIGIPARIVSGISYSDLEETRGFNPHAWIEVYFNDIGWVPFDANYAEFGFLDNTHIILDYPEENKSQITYSWIGRNVEVVGESNDINISVIKFEEEKFEENDLELEALVFRNSIYLESYNVVYVKIKNKIKSYRTICLKISENKNIILEDDVENCVVLKPESESVLYWVLRTNNFERGFIYKVPVVIYNNMYSINTSFIVSEESPVLNREEAYNFVRSFDKKDYIRKFDFKCSPKEFYEDEENVSCEFKNSGNTILEPFIVCFSNQCSETKLSINDNVTLNFKANTSKIGFSRAEIIIKADNFSKNYFFEYKVIEIPKIEITNVEIPSTTKFKENFRIKTRIKIVSGDLNYAKFEIIHKNFKRELSVENLQEDNEIVIELPSKLLNEGLNDLIIRIFYYDKHQRKYVVEKPTSIELEKLSFWQKILLMLYKIQEKFNLSI